jgi:hypothetical protein
MANNNSGLTNLLNTTNQAINALNNQQPLTQSQQELFKSDGFLVPATFSADGNGLPYTKVPSFKQGTLNRNIITWYVPQFGTVRMFVNPAAISYNHKKLITKDRTKGGYTLQYWGEELTTLNISGTTGSSGIEGINALYEVYRAEQYAFDAVGLTLAANNASADVANNIIGGVGASLGNQVNQLFGGAPNSPTAAAGGAGLLGGILGLDSPNNNLSAKNIPSLGQLAFTVEMYYGGWVYRGFFENMTVNERADNFLLEYQMTFTATQRRGYRVNYFPFTRSANNGPSQYSSPQAFSGNVSTSQSGTNI